MKIVIEIPDEVYERFGHEYREENLISKRTNDIILDAICNGTPLPNGHGRLIDADYLGNVSLLHNWHGNNKYIVPYSDRRGYRLREREVKEAIINVPTIIEADTESEDKENGNK